MWIAIGQHKDARVGLSYLATATRLEAESTERATSSTKRAFI